MFGLDLLPFSDAAHLNFELSDLEWAASTAQPGASAALVPCSQAQVLQPAAQESNSSGSSVEESIDSALPDNWSIHILTLLSKDRSPVEPRPATSANAADTAYQTSSAQEQSDAQLLDKAIKQREKNKRAQKRHRDRIKAKEEETSQQIAALSAELKKTQWEKTVIEQRAETLSTALAVRASTSSKAERMHNQTDHNYEYWPSSGWIPQAVLKSTLHLGDLGSTGTPELMTAEQVKAMTVPDHQHFWRMLVFKLANLIPETHGRLDSAAGLRVKEVMIEHGMRIACVASFNFAGFHELMTSNMETGQQAMGMPADKWRSVAAAAEFTDAQRRQIFRVRRLYYQHCGAIASARNKIAPWLQRQGFQSTFPGMASQFVTSHSAMLQLQENLVQEQNLFVSLMGSVWRRTCTTMQTSIMIVQAYPLVVDLISVMNCLAEDAGEPSAVDLMAGFSNCSFSIDSSALRVPSPDLLLEAAHWTIDYPSFTA